MSCKSKLLTFVVILLHFGTGILAITAIVTNHWGVIPSESKRFGLTSVCDQYETCSSAIFIGADDVQNLLITVFALGTVFAMTYGIMELIRTYACFAVLCFVSFFLALLSFAAMLHSVVLFNSIIGSPYKFSWSFTLGWMSVLTAAMSGALSFYLYWTAAKTTESSLSDAAAINTVTGNMQSTPGTNEWIVPPTS